MIISHAAKYRRYPIQPMTRIGCSRVRSWGRRLRSAPFLLYVPLRGNEGRRLLAKAKRVGKKSTHFIIKVRGADLVVSFLNGKFKAIYYKPSGRPKLILRERTKTDDEALGGSISGRGCQGARAGVDCVSGLAGACGG